MLKGEPSFSIGCVTIVSYFLMCFMLFFIMPFKSGPPDPSNNNL